MNLVVLIGRTGDVVNIKQFEGGGKVGSLSLATDESYVDRQTKEKISKTEWHRLVIPERLCDVFEKYVGKGQKISITGKLRTRVFEYENVKRSITEIRVDSFEFCESKNQTNSAPQQNQQSVANPSEPFVVDGPPDDLPF